VTAIIADLEKNHNISYGKWADARRDRAAGGYLVVAPHQLPPSRTALPGVARIRSRRGRCQ
jgi:hypothetical protein